MAHNHHELEVARRDSLLVPTDSPLGLDLGSHREPVGCHPHNSPGWLLGLTPLLAGTHSPSNLFPTWQWE